jgi:hypothetical protein
MPTSLDIALETTPSVPISPGPRLDSLVGLGPTLDILAN